MQHGFLEREPVLFLKELGLFEKEPGLSKKEPGLFEKEPGLSKKEPGLSKKEPGLFEKEPGLSKKEPGLFEKEPGLFEKEPGLLKKEPRLFEKEPGLFEKEPGLFSKFDFVETILSVLNKTAEFLRKHGVPNAKLDAQLLLAHGLGLKRMDLFLRFDQPLSEAELGALRPMVARRAKREPLQHILGSASFRGHEIKCDRRALIPRQETELMIDILIELLGARGEEKKPRILDAGTGSGALAIAAALELGADVTALDISEDALALARENAALHGLGGKISFLRSDLLAGLPAGAKFDAILANLPYIPLADAASLQPEVINGDPHVALFGGADGLEAIRRLLNSCAGFLKPGAPAILEIASAQENALRSESFAGLRLADVRKDYSGLARCAVFFPH